jgi:serine phosphatase RsbU (regulator of sigma subunit)
VVVSLAAIHPGKNTLTFYSTGLPIPIRLRANKLAKFSPKYGSPLSYPLRSQYRGTTIKLSRGDVFFFYSDGLTEEQNPSGQIYEDERLSEMIRVSSGRSESAQEWLNPIRGDVRAFTKAQEMDDDLAAVVMRVLLQHTPKRATT